MTLRLIKRTSLLSSLYRSGTFDVSHSIDAYNGVMAPFDSYSFAVSAFAIEKSTNRSVPIVTFAAGDALDNFVVESSETKTKNNYTYDSGTGPTTVEVESSVIHIRAKRTTFARAFTMCLFLVNWALTIGSTYITVLLAFGDQDPEMDGPTPPPEIDNGVLLFPVTIIVTIPALRSLYVGSPPLGIVIGKPGVLRS
jgi:hypothetical protein